MPGATKYIHQWDRDLEDVEVLAEDSSSGILLDILLANFPAMSVDINGVWYLPGGLFQVNAPAHSSHQCSRALVFHSEMNHFMTLNPVSFSYIFFT